MTDEHRIEPLRDTVARLTIENNHMRYLIAASDMPCLYCHLPKAEMSRCASGFPGCGRADDLMATELKSPI